ncbi:MAG: chlorite dismutase family protein [Acidimicrobiia bacterium]
MSETAVQPSIGWGVLHLFYRVDRERLGDPDAAKRFGSAVEALERDGHQALTFAVLGHKADLGVMALGPDLHRLQAFQHELLGAAPLIPTWSYLSLTEMSEYGQTEEEERHRLIGRGAGAEEVEEGLAAFRVRIAEYLEHRLHPRLPMKRLICFYPMTKRRTGSSGSGSGDNWYRLSFEERRSLMGGHARVGRSFSGRILQLVTGSFGLDDWEWGVTLLADDPVALKEILYEMRFDQVSALYGEFGPFIVGLLSEPAEVARRVGLAG